MQGAQSISWMGRLSALDVSCDSARVLSSQQAQRLNEKLLFLNLPEA